MVGSAESCTELAWVPAGPSFRLIPSPDKEKVFRWISVPDKEKASDRSHSLGGRESLRYILNRREERESVWEILSPKYGDQAQFFRCTNLAASTFVLQKHCSIGFFLSIDIASPPACHSFGNFVGVNYIIRIYIHIFVLIIFFIKYVLQDSA